MPNGQCHSIACLTQFELRSKMKVIQCLIFGVVCCLSVTVQPAFGYRILGVFPTPSISHQVVFRGLTLALRDRGHELVVLTPDPVRNPNLVNYTEIDTSSIYHKLQGVANITGRLEATPLDWIKNMHPILVDVAAGVLEHPKMRELYAPDSEQKFDLLLIEILFWESILPLATRFKVPVIGITSLGLTINAHLAIGNPMISNQLATFEIGAGISEDLSFWQRLNNFYTIWYSVYWYRTHHLPIQNALAKKYFGNNISDLDELSKCVSLIFVNQQGPISYARPNIPKVIEIGGFHISEKSIDMPEDLTKILDEATLGFIYVSLGSNVKSNELPTETRHAFISAFSRLPYEVLWKFEDDVLPNKPNNVHIMKWVPQQAVLAHPNLKVFVYQGGLQSTEEAVEHGVPLIGLPVFGDQDMQVHKMASLGVAIKLEITTVNENELFEAITTVATNISFKQKMLNLRSLINDKPYDPLENAVWWTEHVIRHKGAPYLHSIGADQPWYSRQDMDIVASITAAFLILLSSTLVVLYKIIKNIHKTYTIQTTLYNKKMN